MATIFAKKSTSDHILVQAFPTAKAKGETCTFGSLVGFSDYTTAQGAEGTVNVGKQIAVFQIARDGVTAAIGTDVYIASDGTLTTTVGSNKLLGTVVVVGPDTYDVAITG